MKKKALFLQILLAASLLFTTAAYAAEISSTRDIAIGSSGQMEMIGTIEPNILSVTMPTFVPFSISNSIPSQNKVVSPRIHMKNNSYVPVEINVVYTDVNISKLQNTQWSDTGNVGPNQIAIGLKKGTAADKMPEDISQAHWLKANRPQNLNVLNLDANETGALYVVGTLGQNVSENAAFNVTPTFVVRNASQN